MIKPKYLLLLILLLSPFLFASAQDKAQIAALEKALAKTNDDNTKVKLFGDLCWNYSFISFDKALYYGNQELATAQKLKNDTTIALAYSDLGIAYNRGGNFKQALVSYEQSLALRKKLKLNDKVAGTLSNIATIYEHQGNYLKAIQYMNNALKIYTALKDEQHEAILLSNIGTLYIDNSKFTDAKKYLEESLEISRRLNLKTVEGNNLTNLGNYYRSTNNDNMAVTYYEQAVKLFTELNDLHGIATNNNNLGSIYQKKKLYQKAVNYLQKSLASRREIKDSLGIASTYKNLTDAYIPLKNYRQADSCITAAISIFTAIDAKDYLREAYILSSKLKEQEGKYDESLQQMKMAYVLRDTVFSQQASNKINELQVTYETEKKEQHIKLLSKQAVIQQLKIDKRNTTIAIIGGLFLISLGFGSLFYNRYRLKQAGIFQQAMIRQQQLASKGIIEAEERERKRIASDLHDGVGQLFSTVKMNLGSLLERMDLSKNDDNSLAEKTMAMVDESCREVRTIAHQMMPNVLLKMGLASAVRDFVNKIDSHRLKVVLETFGLTERLDNNVEIVLYRVIQESVNNVIKHAGANLLDIQLVREDNGVSVTIEDNGKGFDTADRSKFDGIGLKNIATRIEYLKGTVDISSAVNKGTLIAIYIPLEEG